MSEALTRLARSGAAHGAPAASSRSSLDGLDPDALIPLLAEAAGLAPTQGAGASWSPEVLKDKPGKRVTIRFTLVSAGDAGPAPPLSLVAKVYMRREQASAVYGHMHALRRLGEGLGSVCIPAPLVLAPELGLLLQEHVEGRHLGRILQARGPGTPLSLAAAWLARLHAAPPLPGLPPRPLAHEIGKAERWLRELARCLPASDARKLTRLEDALHAAAGGLPEARPVTIHRDFYYQNVLWDDERVWILDFDELAAGDAALDVGHFVAHAQALACTTTGDPGAFREQVALFVGAYLERSPIEVRRGLPVYSAYTFVKLAATHARRRPTGWLGDTRVLVDLASRELERGRVS